MTLAAQRLLEIEWPPVIYCMTWIFGCVVFFEGRFWLLVVREYDGLGKWGEKDDRDGRG